MHSLIWFRSDLRVHDNTALAEACRSADRVTAVFLTAADQWREHDWGPAKVGFTMRNVAALAASLGARGISLEVVNAPRFSDAAAALVRLAESGKCNALFFNREYEVNERRRDRAVRAALAGAGVEVRAFDDQTVLSPGQVRTGGGGYFKIFTPFKRAWLREIDLRGRPLPVEPPRAFAVPETLEGFPASRASSSQWPAGEDAARRRLEEFTSGALAHYRRDRDLPAIDGTSGLSAYLAVGAISPRQCLAAAADANHGSLDEGSDGVTSWISELIWREFYRHVLVGYPRVSMGLPFKLETEAIEWSDDSEGFDRWREGQTGVPIVDAAMRQLAAIGWMHNRLRMIVAMYLTKDLFVDWRRGERHFMQSLVDGDLASNNGGWQWSASTGCDAAPYFRIFNPVSQSRRFDPDGRFILRYCPELEGLSGKYLHDPAKLPEGRRAGLRYPRPIVDHAFARQRAVGAFKKLR